MLKTEMQHLVEELGEFNSLVDPNDEELIDILNVIFPKNNIYELLAVIVHMQSKSVKVKPEPVLTTNEALLMFLSGYLLGFNRYKRVN